MIFERRRSLRFKLGFFSSLLVIFVAGSVSYYIREGQKSGILERQKENQELTIRSLRQVARESILVDDDTPLANHMNLLKQFPNVAYAMVLNDDGRVRVHTDPLEIGKLLDDPFTKKTLLYRARGKPLIGTETMPDGRVITDMALPVIIRENPEEFRGVARIGFDKAQIDEEIQRSLYDVDRQILRAFLFAMALGLLGAIFLAGVITRPIKIVKDGAKKIGEGKLDYRIKVSSNDEIGDLATEFNLMAQKLGELDQMKQDFVSNVTHELRSPMTSIRGYTDLLLHGSADTPETLRDYLTIIKNSAVRLGRFIDNLLDVAKIEAHRLKLTPESQNIGELAHEMVVLFKPQADEKKLSLVNNVAPALPLAFVDKDKIAEVFINLTSNAIKFTPEGGTVTIEAKEGSNYLEVAVEDSGIGIPAEMIGKLFNKFEQVKTTKGLARAQKGTGLGLMIAKGIVEAHGGKIWIKSPAANGKGTAFVFTLPKLTPEIEAKLNA